MSVEQSVRNDWFKKDPEEARSDHKYLHKNCYLHLQLFQVDIPPPINLPGVGDANSKLEYSCTDQSHLLPCFRSLKSKICLGSG